MINILSESDEGLRPAGDIIKDLRQNPHKITEEIVLDISEWQEEIHASLGFKVKKRYGFIEGGHDCEGYECKIVACFFRACPLQNVGEISKEQSDGLNEVLTQAMINIRNELREIYEESIYLELFPIPAWMVE